MANVDLIGPMQLVLCQPPKNMTGAAATTEYVSLKGFNRATIIIVSGAWAGGTAAVTLNQATDVAATGTKALGFDYMWTNIASVASPALVKTAVVADTFNLGTANATWIIPINAAMLDVDNSFDCLNCAIATPGANNDYYALMILLSESRYAEDLPPINAHVD